MSVENLLEGVKVIIPIGEIVYGKTVPEEVRKKAFGLQSQEKTILSKSGVKSDS